MFTEAFSFTYSRHKYANELGYTIEIFDGYGISFEIITTST